MLALLVARRCCEFLDRHRRALDLEVDRRHLAVALDEGEAERLTRSEPLQPGLFDRADVDEHVFAAIVARDEAEALRRVEEFHRALALARSEEHTSELQSLMRNSYAVLCLKTNNTHSHSQSDTPL